MSTFHINGISAVWRRQLGSLLGNPLGYVFIFAFVVVSSLFLFWPDSFYGRNIADLGPLFAVMPWLLVILVPSLAMGSWSSERELGTEELLLTLPLGVIDALLGKYLAIVSYFTLALACSLTNVVVLMWLGSPDLGLVIANYLGWWFAGLALAGVGLLASVQVGSAAIAFVIGAAYSGIILWGANAVGWFDPFNRGVVTISGVISALAVAVASIGLAVLQLSSRRWRPHSTQQVVSQVMSMAFALIVAVNIARISGRHNVDADVSTEGLASISQASAEILSKAERKVKIAVFISETLPADLQLKGKEVEDKALALQRASQGKVEVEVRHPVDPTDASGTLATKDYGLKPFKAVVETVSGHEEEDVFLGAAVVCGGHSQVIASFDPGLSVEFELVRAVRAVASAKKKVLGLAATDLKMTADFDFQTGQMRQAWSLIDEWRKQYEIRDVNLDSEVASDVDVLVVPLPSSLTQTQVEHLNDYVWNGRPALLLEDPLPMFSNPQLAPSMPKKGANNPYQPPNPDQPQKADLKPLYHALGLDFDLTQVVWSDYNPSHQFRGVLRPSFVWVTRDQKGVLDTPTTTGIDSVLLPFPGAIQEASDRRADLKVTRLLQTCADSPWGKTAFSEHITQGMMGMQPREPSKYLEGDRTRPPALAVEITGTMGSAYPKLDPTAKKDDKPEAKKDEAKKDEAKKDDKPEAKKDDKEKVGVPSPKPVHVIVVADTDMASNEFYDMYRSAGSRLPKEVREQYAELFSLRNVQFLANCVDALAGDQAFLAVRNRRPQPRPLTRLEAVLVATASFLRKESSAAELNAESSIAKAQHDFDERVAKVDNQEGIDENAKEQLKANIRASEQRKLDERLKQIDEQKTEQIHAAKVDQRRVIMEDRLKVKFWAICTPATLMLLLVLAVSANRLRQERTHIPPARKRHTA